LAAILGDSLRLGEKIKYSVLFIKFDTMNTMRIDILNPKAAKLLKDLADLNLIAIQDTSKSGFANVLKKLRLKAKSAPTFDEITKEVELVRSKRYAK
jgi:hypothetical protein